MTIADLETAIANVQAQQTALANEVVTALADFQAEIAALQAAAGSGDTAAIQTSIDNLNAISAGLSDSLAKLTAADPGAQAAAEGIVDAPTAGTGNEDPTDPNSPNAAPPATDSTSDATSTDASSTDTTTSDPSAETESPSPSDA